MRCACGTYELEHKNSHRTDYSNAGGLRSTGMMHGFDRCVYPRQHADPPIQPGISCAHCGVCMGEGRLSQGKAICDKCDEKLRLAARQAAAFSSDAVLILEGTRAPLG